MNAPFPRTFSKLRLPDPPTWQERMAEEIAMLIYVIAGSTALCGLAVAWVFIWAGLPA
jgi:hypothetical protein